MRNKLRKKGRYVTKASLRHITANDEASSLSGDFIIAHHSPALFKKGEEGRKKGSFTSIQMLHTHMEHIHCFETFPRLRKSVRWNWISSTWTFWKYRVNSNIIHQLIHQLIHHFTMSFRCPSGHPSFGGPCEADLQQRAAAPALRVSWRWQRLRAQRGCGLRASQRGLRGWRLEGHLPVWGWKWMRYDDICYFMIL